MANVMRKIFALIVGIVLISEGRCSEFSPQKYYLGTIYSAKSDRELKPIEDSDVHYNWELGKFFINGFTKVIANPNKPIIFLKNTGDKVGLWFHLKQDINCLNGKEELTITEGGVNHQDQGLGTLRISHINYQNLSRTKPYTNYLKALSVGADTKVTLFEEGDYEVILDYQVKENPSWWWPSSNTNYCIKLKFSVRNGNCMIFLRDVKTKEELTTSAPNGFYIDLTKSRYLDINVKKEILEDDADKLDVRFNRPAKDGEQYTEKGVYTITLKNRYTKETTTKVVSVGNDPILNHYAATLLPISKIKKQLKHAKKSVTSATKNLKKIFSDFKDNLKKALSTERPKRDEIDIKSGNREKLNPGEMYAPIIINKPQNNATDNVNNSNSPKKLTLLQEEIRERLSKDLKDNGYKLEKLEAIYLSQEYIEELLYNSRSNEYFGYSLKDIEKQFKGEKYVFTLGDDNKTVVRAFKDTNEDIFRTVIKDVAIGSGVIIIAATATAISGGSVGVILATVAQAGKFAVSSAVLSSVIDGAITGIQTKNFDKTIKSMAIAGADGFKWGAIAGTLIGGVSKVKASTKIAQLAGILLGSKATKMAVNSKNVNNAIKAGATQKGISSLVKSEINSKIMTSSATTATSNALKSDTVRKAVWDIGRNFEKKVCRKLKIPKIDQQVTLKNGTRIKYGEKGYPRVDAVLWQDGRLIAVEIKSYDLEKGLYGLIQELKRQVTERALHCSEQLVVIDKRHYSKKFLDKTIEIIQKELRNELQKLKVSDKKFANISTDVMLRYM